MWGSAIKDATAGVAADPSQVISWSICAALIWSQPGYEKGLCAISFFFIIFFFNVVMLAHSAGVIAGYNKNSDDCYLFFLLLWLWQTGGKIFRFCNKRS